MEGSGGEAYSYRGDVRQIGSDARCVDNIEESKLVDERRDLAEQRQWL